MSVVILKRRLYMCRQTKKVIRILLIVSLCLLLCSCYDGDLYKGRRPIDYPNSYWVCEEYDAYFLVGEDKELIDAKITIDGQTVPFKFIWRSNNDDVSMTFTANSQKCGMVGSCKFRKKKFTISVEYTEGYYPKEQIIMKFERRTIEEYIADHSKSEDGSFDGIDPYKGQRPIDYPNSYWVCEEAQMYFLVGENQKLTDAKVTMYGQTVPCEFAWAIVDNSINITFRVDSQTYESYGVCEFGEDKFTIQIEYKENSGEGPLLEFERRTLEEYLADHG